MKILQVNTNDIDGGAARAAYRLHKALLDQNIDSLMLVKNKISNDYTVMKLNDNMSQKIINKFLLMLDQNIVKFYKNRTKTLFSPNVFGNKNILKKIEKINPDIIHLHWINNSMLKIDDLSKIKQPIVWSLHDMWAFTGGCHYDEECKGFVNSCGNCKVLNSGKKKDLSKRVWSRKNKTFSKMNNLRINGLSTWIMNCSKESSLLKDKKHINLPNPINTDIYKPFNKEKSRELWNLPKNKKLILFGAMGATSDPRKGFKELSKALKLLETDNVEFVIFGSSKPQNAPGFKFKTHYVGRLHDDISLVTLYSAVDVMVVPSLQENLSNAIMESLSCSTPVVAFNIGGNSDMIEHKRNGYLAKPFESKDLANGIEWILNLDENKYNKLCNDAREKVLKEFDSKVVAKRYIEFYKEILNGQS